MAKNMSGDKRKQAGDDDPRATLAAGLAAPRGRPFARRRPCHLSVCRARTYLHFRRFFYSRRISSLSKVRRPHSLLEFGDHGCRSLQPRHGAVVIEVQSTILTVVDASLAKEHVIIALPDRRRPENRHVDVPEIFQAAAIGGEVFRNEVKLSFG